MRKVTTGAIAALILFTASGCVTTGSAGGGTYPSQQSVADACDIAGDEAQNAQDALTQALASVDEEDYAAASDTIRAATDDMDSALTQVTNDRVRDELEDLNEDMKEVGIVIDEMEAVTGDTAALGRLQADLTDDAMDARDSAAELSAACA